MKVVLDEGVPEPLALHLSGHAVQSVRQLGWKGMKNGRLLKAIEDAGFDAFLTNDKNMESEQRLLQRPFAVLILSACNLPVILPHLETIREALDACQPGTVRQVECGRFIPLLKRRTAAS